MLLRDTDRVCEIADRQKLRRVLQLMHGKRYQPIDFERAPHVAEQERLKQQKSRVRRLGFQQLQEFRLPRERQPGLPRGHFHHHHWNLGQRDTGLLEPFVHHHFVIFRFGMSHDLAGRALLAQSST